MLFLHASITAANTLELNNIFYKGFHSKSPKTHLSLLLEVPTWNLIFFPPYIHLAVFYPFVVDFFVFALNRKQRLLNQNGVSEKVIH